MFLYVMEDSAYARLSEQVARATTLEEMKEALRDILIYLNFREVEIPTSGSDYTPFSGGCY